jgi:hypothetical protein
VRSDIGELEGCHKFRGSNVLCVHEAPEPTEVVWEKLSNATYGQTIGKNAVSLVTCVIVCFAAFGIIGLVHSFHSHEFTALVISILQSIVPPIIDAATDTEVHESRSSIELAIMEKTFLFEVLITAAAIKVYTPFHETLNPEYLDQVMQLLLFDGVLAPIVEWLQPWTYFSRRWVAPLKETTVEREGYFRGQHVQIGAQLARRTSTLFLGLFSLALLPVGVGFTFAAFFAAYWTCKHGIFRRWLRLPCYGTQLLPLTCFLTFLPIVTSLGMAGQFFYGWPFDSVCHTDGDFANPPYLCDKKPPAYIMHQSQEWMTPGQRDLVLVARYMCMTLASLLTAWWFSVGAVWSVRSLFFGYTGGVGDDQGAAYTTVDEVQAYIPFLEHDLLETPLIACDRSKFDDEYIHFQVRGSMVVGRWAIGPWMCTPDHSPLPQCCLVCWSRGRGQCAGADHAVMHALVRCFLCWICVQGDYASYDLYSDVERLLKSTGVQVCHAAGGKGVCMLDMFSSCTFFPTVDNPDPTKKVDDGDECLGKLWVTIVSADGLACGRLRAGHCSRASMQHLDGMWETSWVRYDKAISPVGATACDCVRACVRACMRACTYLRTCLNAWHARTPIVCRGPLICKL